MTFNTINSETAGSVQEVTNINNNNNNNNGNGKIKNKEKQTNKSAIYGMYIVTTLNFLSMSLFSPLINQQVRELEATPFIMGIVGTVYGATGLLSTPTIMIYSNFYGTKNMFIFCLISTFIVHAIQGGTSMLLIFVALRSLGGIVKHTQTLGKAVLAEFVERSELPYIFGYYHAFSNIGVIFGPAIGGRLIQFPNGCQLICLLNGILFLVQITIFMRLIKSDSNENTESDPKAQTVNNHSTTRSLILTLKGNTDICINTIGIFCFAVGSNTLRANFPLIVYEKFGASITSISYINSLQSFTFALSGFVITPFTKKHFSTDVKKMVLFPAFVQLISLFGQFVATSLSIGTMFLLLSEVAKSFLWVALAAWSLQGKGDTGIILGLNRMAHTSAVMLSPVIAGIIQSSFLTFDGPAILGGVFTLFGILLVLFEKSHFQQNKEK